MLHCPGVFPRETKIVRIICKAEDLRNIFPQGNGCLP
jgi:hypothetical protein